MSGTECLRFEFASRSLGSEPCRTSLSLTSNLELLNDKPASSLPYCVADDHFKPMVPHLDGRFICLKCGHVVFPTDPAFTCSCYRCQKTFVRHSNQFRAKRP